jgi:hypothetical protein
MSTLQHRLPKIALMTALVAVLVLVPLSTVFAANPPPSNGQPNQSCEDLPFQPGHSISAPGSAFNPDGKAGTVYAGNQAVNSKNPMSVSQYDVACFQQSQH